MGEDDTPRLPSRAAEGMPSGHPGSRWSGSVVRSGRMGRADRAPGKAAKLNRPPARQGLEAIASAGRTFAQQRKAAYWSRQKAIAV